VVVHLAVRKSEGGEEEESDCMSLLSVRSRYSHSPI
jgi:hypothetical protein